MKIKVKKFEHSCLLIEVDKKKFLYDPGDYSKEKLLNNLNLLNNLDYILITHEHFDHFNLDLVKKIILQNPNVKLVAPKTITEKIDKNPISSRDVNISIEKSKHEALFDKDVPENFSITIMDKFTHPGDSLQFKETADILALPIQAPWGSMTQAANYAIKKKPKYIIPIHDWQWKDEVRKGMYERLEAFFQNYNIKFLNIYEKESVVIDL